MAIPVLFTSDKVQVNPLKFGPTHWNNVTALLTGLLAGAEADGRVLTKQLASPLGAVWSPPASVDLSGLVLTSDARLSDARPPLAHTQAFSTLTGLPSTLAGYGIPAITKADVGLGVVENTALSTWAGSANLVTLGAASALNLTLPAVVAGGVSGVFAGTRALVRFFKPALAAGGQASGENVFVGGGNSTMTNGAGVVDLASFNVAVGWDALLSATTTSQSVAIGHRALKALTTGLYNVAVGGGALLNNATNLGNVAVGTSALLTLTASGGDYNTALGHDALEFLQTGALNTAVGKRSNWQMTSGSNNTSIGGDCMYANLTGATNTAVGQNALYANTSGASNVAIGASALAANNGSSCVAIGQASLFNLLADSHAIGIGTSAGRYLANGSTSLTVAPQSIFLGGLTKSKQDSQFNEIVIGYAAVGAGTRTAVIGAVDVTDVYLGSAIPNANLRAKSGIFGGYLEHAGQSRVSAQFDKTSDAALANVPGLTVTVEAGKTYTFVARLYTVSGSSGGVKYAIGGTCTATAIIYDGETLEGNTTSTHARSVALGGAVGGLTGATAAVSRIYGTITVANAGTLTVQFAQNTGNATPSSVLIGSTFTVQRIA